MPLLHRAAWVLPIAAPPIRDGWVLVDRGCIVAVGAGNPPVAPEQGTSAPQASQAAADSRPLAPDSWDQSAILPGLVNAHTHLELSWMRGRLASQPGSSMPEWASGLLALRRTLPNDPAAPIAQAVVEMRVTGTALVGDITNSMASCAPLAGSALSAFVFREVLGFNVAAPEQLVRAAQAEVDALTPLARIRGAVVPHAPYSVSPALLRAIADAAGGSPMSVHLGESREELEFLRLGTGPWRRLLEQLGVWTDAWPVPGCWPVEYLDRFGLVNDRLLAVHCVQLSDDELGRLAEARATVVTCPRSNRWTGAGTPPVDRFYRSGVRVAIGTDSLASVEDLNMFNEIAAVRALAPSVPAARILESATRAGAAALGFGGECGTVEPGKRADLIAVGVPAGVTDVEEYLLSGRVSPSDIRWLDAY